MELSLPLRALDQQGVRPAITPESEPFWAAAARGELVVEECPGCGLHIFPPRGVCRRCLRRDLTWTRVQPPGVLASFTVNHNAWSDGVEDVYGIGLVEFPRYSSVRFVGFLDQMTDPPVIGSLVDFAFVASTQGIHRIFFAPWREA